MAPAARTVTSRLVGRPSRPSRGPEVAGAVDDEHDLRVLVAVGRGRRAACRCAATPASGSGGAGRPPGTAGAGRTRSRCPGRPERYAPTSPSGCGIGAVGVEDGRQRQRRQPLRLAQVDRPAAVGAPRRPGAAPHGTDRASAPPASSGRRRRRRPRGGLVAADAPALGQADDPDAERRVLLDEHRRRHGHDHVVDAVGHRRPSPAARVTSPSRSVPCPTAVATVTAPAARRSHAQVARPASGVTRTSRSGRFIADAPPTAPTTPSRVGAEVGGGRPPRRQHGRPRGAGHDGRAIRAAEGVGTVRGGCSRPRCAR